MSACPRHEIENHFYTSNLTGKATQPTVARTCPYRVFPLFLRNARSGPVRSRRAPGDSWKRSPLDTSRLIGKPRRLLDGNFLFFFPKTIFMEAVIENKTVNL